MFLAVAAMMLTGCKGGGSGPDLAAMGKAMSEAKSYRMTTVASGSEVSMEIECPNKVHTTSKTAGNTSEMVAIDTAMYMKAGGKWMKSPVAGTAPTVCATPTTTGTTNTSGGASPEVTKGANTTINGVACQEWTIGAAAASTTYCIGSDNYPVQIKTSAATVTYSDWNKVQVQAPQM